VAAAAREACGETSFDVIVHSMAIGDYRVRAVSDAGHMAGNVLERLSVLACGDSSSPEEAVRDALVSPPDLREAKIPSDKENLIVVLEKTPKIISMFRELAPDAVIFGFKLLSNVSEDELLEAGHSLLRKNKCDFILANDMRTVGVEAGHEGYLISQDGSFERATGKEAIAALLVKRALEASCLTSLT
jgi:phosphopantothenate-cysteine ligase